MLHFSHLHHLNPLAAPGLVPEVHEHVGVEREHETERNDKNCQKDDSEVEFLHCI